MGFEGTARLLKFRRKAWKSGPETCRQNLRGFEIPCLHGVYTGQFDGKHGTR
jgi:hypothetical protein